MFYSQVSHLCPLPSDCMFDNAILVFQEQRIGRSSRETSSDESTDIPPSHRKTFLHHVHDYSVRRCYSPGVVQASHVVSDRQLTL